MKRGLTHIEMILSFVIFVGAIGFALYFFSPTRTSKLVDTSLEYVEREIANNVSVILKTYSLKINNTNNQIGSSLVVEIEGICESRNYNSRAENISKGFIPSKIGRGNSGCNLNSDKEVFIKNENYWRDEDFIYLKISEDFEEPPSGISHNDAFSTLFYSVSTSDVKEIFSEKRVLLLNNTYHANYFDLKELFNLPGRVNFGFSLIFDDYSIRAERNIPSGLEVFSKSERIEVLKANGEVVYADFIMQVW